MSNTYAAVNKTYGEQRSAAEKIQDEDLKERVLRGLAVLREQYGEDWADYIDPAQLDMGSAYRCILGQCEPHHALYDPDPAGAGFDAAIRRIDGELADNPAYFAFDIEHEDYYDLDEAWFAVLGIERL